VPEPLRQLPLTPRQWRASRAHGRGPAATGARGVRLRELLEKLTNLLRVGSGAAGRPLSVGDPEVRVGVRVCHYQTLVGVSASPAASWPSRRATSLAMVPSGWVGPVPHCPTATARSSLPGARHNACLLDRIRPEASWASSRSAGRGYGSTRTGRTGTFDGTSSGPEGGQSAQPRRAQRARAARVLTAPSCGPSGSAESAGVDVHQLAARAVEGTRWATRAALLARQRFADECVACYRTGGSRPECSPILGHGSCLT
jgi:hypothetical protein